MENPEKLEKKIGTKFTNKNFLLKALTHKSYAVDSGIKTYNERLEFLGDSILSAVVASYLYTKHESYSEGDLSKIKSAIVSKPTLVSWAKKIELGDYVLLSKSEEQTGGRKRESILANAFEAIIGAIYLDRGFEESFKFILKRLKNYRMPRSDYKTKLQEIIQKKYKLPPEYKIFSETGPDHDKVFEVEVRIKKEILGQGNGKSKKAAEQNSAKDALSKLKVKG